MKITDVIKILRKNFMILLIFPSMLAALVYYMTRNEVKEYSSNFLVYTGLASGYDLTTEEHPRLDHNAVNNAFDNLLTTLKARETIEEVGVRLLATHILLDKPDDRIVSAEFYHRTKQLMPDSIETKIRASGNMEEAVKVIYSYKNAPGDNAIKRFLNSGYEIYGINHISSKVSANRKALSDMVEVSYSANDPAICEQTLQILSEVFVRRYKEIKSGEINNVVIYFSEQTKKSEKKLREAEQNLQAFEVKYKIINYSEQTKGISAGKQELMDNIQKEKLLLSSSNATVKNLESKIDLKKGLMEANDKVVVKRQQLAELNYRIANATMDPAKQTEVVKLRKDADEVKEEIRLIVNELYELNNSTEGLPRNNLITQWLNNKLIVDESTARLRIQEERLKEFDAMYNQYAPLGATLTSLQREVTVAEKEYLDQLNALNINKERQQNIEMATNIKIVDKPFFPLQPKSSKRMMLVAGSFFAGFMLIFSGFLVVSFFDNRINTPLRAEQLTGLKVCGALPLIRKNEKRFDVEYLESSLMEQAISAIVLEIRQRGGLNSGTKFIMVSSTKAAEGKTWCAYKLASKLGEIRGKVLYLYPKDATSPNLKNQPELRLEDTQVDFAEYAITKDFVGKESIHQLLPRYKGDFEKYTFVLIEIPSLSENQLPVELVKRMDMSLLVVRADRAWSETDNYVTKLYTKACNCDPMILLNAVSPDGLKEIFGDIPKKRKSGFRSAASGEISREQEAKV